MSKFKDFYIKIWLFLKPFTSTLYSLNPLTLTFTKTFWEDEVSFKPMLGCGLINPCDFFLVFQMMIQIWVNQIITQTKTKAKTCFTLFWMVHLKKFETILWSSFMFIIICNFPHVFHTKLLLICNLLMCSISYYNFMKVLDVLRL